MLLFFWTVKEPLTQKYKKFVSWILHPVFSEQFLFHSQKQMFLVLVAEIWRDAS